MSGSGVAVNPGKVSAISELPEPTSRAGIRSFIGACSYYRRFVKGFASLAAPLTRVMSANQADQSFIFGSEQREAFRSLKAKLLQPPILAHPDETRPYHLFTDASRVGLGAVLSQEGDETTGFLHPVEFASRVVRGAEVRYSVPELDCLAVVWALRKFRHLVLGTALTVYTDHAALRQVLGSARHDVSGKFARWAIVVCEYGPTIRHIPREQNKMADLLSQQPTVPPHDDRTVEDRPTEPALVVTQADRGSVAAPTTPAGGSDEFLYAGQRYLATFDAAACPLWVRVPNPRASQPDTSHAGVSD